MSLIVEIKVTPQSGRQAIVIDKSGILKFFLIAPPEDGKANKEVVQIISQKLNIKKTQIDIISGLTSRKKRIEINAPLSYQQFLQQLGLEHQHTMFAPR